MASQYSEPAAPQTEVVTTGNGNNAARINAYVDLALTKRNIEQAMPAVKPDKSGARTLGNIRKVYAEDDKEEIEQTDAAEENQSVVPPVHSPNKWQMQTRSGRRYSRNPYANNGLDGYQQNQGE